MTPQKAVKLVQRLRAIAPDFLAKMQNSEMLEALSILNRKDERKDKKKRKKPTRFKGTDHWITKEQLEQICAVSDPFYATLWRTMAYHALRISEALAIRPQDIEAGMLTVARLKGSQRTTQPLLVDLSALIATGSYRVFARHRSTCFLAFRTAARKVGLHPDLCHPHVLRHSMAHWLLDGGVPLPVASQYLGHTSLASTSAYLNVSDAKASAAAAKVIGPILNGEPSAPAEIDKPSDVLAGAAAQELVATL